MKSFVPLCLGLMIGFLAAPGALYAKELKELKVLYVGEERSDQFVPFLSQAVGKLEARVRTGFNPAAAAGFDVVVLDWPQGREDLQQIRSPLGSRETWTRPTVLLGSAGLHLAVAWKLQGGNGCTCMDPLAYDLRPHEIFERPFLIDRTQSIRIPTPPDFREEIKAPEIKVLPLVADHGRPWRPGWCSYSFDFASNPDVEFFCGGVNHKTPTAAGLWRQGNLLHFGFEPSPAEMNETGRRLLLNAIAYISRFSEDRPIAVTPSPFSGPVARSRARLPRFLRSADFRADWLKDLYGPAVAAQYAKLGRAGMIKWAEHEGRYLHPVGGEKLELDADLVALGVTFDAPEFFERTLAGLRAGGAAAERARRLLHCYVPSGPSGNSSDEWLAWWKAHRRYLFATEGGEYRWYIDPLALRREMPTAELRGPRRADAAR